MKIYIVLNQHPIRLGTLCIDIHLLNFRTLQLRSGSCTLSGVEGCNYLCKKLYTRQCVDVTGLKCRNRNKANKIFDVYFSSSRVLLRHIAGLCNNNVKDRKINEKMLDLLCPPIYSQ